MRTTIPSRALPLLVTLLGVAGPLLDERWAAADEGHARGDGGRPPQRTGAPAAPVQPARARALLDTAFHIRSVPELDADEDGDPDSDDLLAIVALLEVSYRIMDRLVMEAKWGAAFLEIRAVDSDGYIGQPDRIGVGNLFLAGLYTGRYRGVDYAAGLGLALPTASSWGLGGEDPVMHVAADLLFREAAGLHGDRDPWLWREDRLSIVLPARVHARVEDRYHLLGDAGVGTLVRTGGTAHADAVVEIGGVFEYLADPYGIGAGLQAVWDLTADDDGLQISAEPFARWGSVRLSFLMNLDGPRGFALAGGGQWALHLTIASR